MKQTKHSSHKLNISWILLLAATLLVWMSAPVNHRTAPQASAASLQGTVFGHAGNFRYLDAMTTACGGVLQTQYEGLSCSGLTALSAKVTFYGYPDNDSGSNTSSGTNVIAHKLDWAGHSRHRNSQGEPIAGGIGSYADPITVATVTNNTMMGPGTLIYVTRLKKYFLVEDNCRHCTTDWVDLWMESNATNRAAAVTQCEYDWTADLTQLKEILVNPSSVLQVDTAQFFNVGANQCNTVIWY